MPQTVYIFFPRAERIYNLLIVGCVFTSLLEIFYRGHQYAHLDWVRLIFIYVLFDHTHTILTPFILTSIPEGRAYVKENLKNRSTYILGLGLLLILLLTFQILRNYHLTRSDLPLKILAFFLFLAWAQHAFKQIFGLSLLYNRLMLPALDQPQRVRLLKLEIYEKWLFQFYLLTAVLERMMAFMNWNRRTEPFFVATLMLTGGLIHLTAAKYPGGKIWQTKQIYLFRIWLFPLAFFSPLAAITLAIVHGVDYILLGMRMTSRSRSEKRKLLTTLVPVLCWIMVIPAFVLNDSAAAKRIFGTFAHWPDWVIAALGIMAFFTNYLHYFSDSFMFKMSQKEARDNFGPLLGFPRRDP